MYLSDGLSSLLNEGIKIFESDAAKQAGVELSFVDSKGDLYMVFKDEDGKHKTICVERKHMRLSNDGWEYKTT